MLTLAVVVATAIPLLSLYAIYRLDLYGTRSFRIVLLCVAWGIIATRLALLINTAVLDSGRVDPAMVIRVIAPVVEEMAKALIIFYLIFRPRFTYFVDGAIYGFAVGIGFAIVENYHYLSHNPDSPALLAVGRVTSTNLMHASTTAVAGIALALARFEPSGRRRALIGLAGLLAAILMHIAFNTFVTRFAGSVTALYVLAAGCGIAGALGVALTIRVGLAQEKSWIEESLTASKRVAAGETSAVRQLGDADVILRPVAEHFGQRRADEVHALLKLQARLGILLQTSQRLPDGKQKRDTEDEIARLHREMDARRRSIGTYCMFYLRSISVDETGSIWESLHAAASTEAGDDLWARMDTRLAAKGGLRGRATSPRFRRWLAVALYAGLTAAVWLGSRLIDWPAWSALPDPVAIQIALQWLLTMGLLVEINRSDRGLWRNVDRRLAERARRARIHRRLLGKAGRLLVFVMVFVLSAIIWIGPRLSNVAWWSTQDYRLAIQVLAQLLLLCTAVAAIGRLRFTWWVVTAVAIGAEIVYLLKT